ncbi:MAG: hypothetical protein KJ070_01085 [Verrucomicrobia bacterium]|nr:hypothetical protein [Verrucomicrobiota bacterium]
MLAEYQANQKTTNEIAQAHHISLATITVWAKKAGLPLRRRGRRRMSETTPRNRLILELAETLTYEATSRRFGISRQGVWRIVKRWKPVVCPLTNDDLTGDVERLIMRTVTPYVDPSNPMLSLDELQAECRAKLAKIIDSGRLAQCPTRGKMFAFVKTSFRNHVRSLVQKYVFTAKRTGVEPPPRLPLGAACVAAVRKVQIIRLDDPDIGHQVGHDDDRFRQSEFIEELLANLEPSERVQLSALMERANPTCEDLVKDGRSLNTERKVRRTLLQKCRAILAI